MEKKYCANCGTLVGEKTVTCVVCGHDKFFDSPMIPATLEVASDTETLTIKRTYGDYMIVVKNVGDIYDALTKIAQTMTEIDQLERE